MGSLGGRCRRMARRPSCTTRHRHRQGVGVAALWMRRRPERLRRLGHRVGSAIDFQDAPLRVRAEEPRATNLEPHVLALGTAGPVVDGDAVPSVRPRCHQQRLLASERLGARRCRERRWCRRRRARSVSRRSQPARVDVRGLHQRGGLEILADPEEGPRPGVPAPGPARP
jgi:hypothetical protein